jgi:hypothetical protein
MKAAAWAVAALGLALAGCLSEAELGSGAPACPSPGERCLDPQNPACFGEFRVVHQVLERRCGTLDCHGDPARPFLVYGQLAHRRPGGEIYAESKDQYFPGGTEPTTPFELMGTHQSACALEPEKMDAVVKGQAGVDTLTLVRKPRLQEKHKGGRLWGAGTANTGDFCLVAWITGRFAEGENACQAELRNP